MARLNPLEATLFRAVRVMCGLPSGLQAALTGGPVTVDGQDLEPELVLLCRVMNAFDAHRPASPEVLRRKQNRGARIVGGPPGSAEERALGARDLVIPSDGGPIRGRLYSTVEAGAPLLVYAHGGGFIFGDVDSHDAPCRLLCRHAGVHVLSIEYRLAPERIFPDAVEDFLAAFHWAVEHAAELGADPERVAVGGDSAGGNLAAVISQIAVLEHARGGEGPVPVAQLLIYPAVDRRTAWPSLEIFREGYFLTDASIRRSYEQYAPVALHPDRDGNPRLNPLASTDLAGLPPALVVTAGFDPLRDEGEAYGEALRRAGVPVVVRRFGSLVHGFISLVGVSRACRDATVEVAGALRMLLARPRATESSHAVQETA